MDLEPHFRVQYAQGSKDSVNAFDLLIEAGVKVVVSVLAPSFFERLTRADQTLFFLSLTRSCLVPGHAEAWQVL